MREEGEGNSADDCCPYTKRESHWLLLCYGVPASVRKTEESRKGEEESGEGGVFLLFFLLHLPLHWLIPRGEESVPPAISRRWHSQPHVTGRQTDSLSLSLSLSVCLSFPLPLPLLLSASSSSLLAITSLSLSVCLPLPLISLLLFHSAYRCSSTSGPAGWLAAAWGTCLCAATLTFTGRDGKAALRLAGRRQAPRQQPTLLSMKAPNRELSREKPISTSWT